MGNCLDRNKQESEDEQNDDIEHLDPIHSTNIKAIHKNGTTYFVFENGPKEKIEVKASEYCEKLEKWIQEHPNSAV